MNPKLTPVRHIFSDLKQNTISITEAEKAVCKLMLAEPRVKIVEKPVNKVIETHRVVETPLPNQERLNLKFRLSQQKALFKKKALDFLMHVEACLVVVRGSALFEGHLATAQQTKEWPTPVAMVDTLRNIGCILGIAGGSQTILGMFVLGCIQLVNAYNPDITGSFCQALVASNVVTDEIADNLRQKALEAPLNGMVMANLRHNQATSAWIQDLAGTFVEE